MEKIEIGLINTKLENVFGFLTSRLQSSSGKSQSREILKDDYADGVTRTVTYSNTLRQPYLDKGKLIVEDHYYIMVYPGKTDLTVAEVVFMDTFDGLVFTGLQLQNDTVEIQFECSKVWEEFANGILSELRRKFPDPPIPSGPGYWALVQNRARNNMLIFGGKTKVDEPSQPETVQDVYAVIQYDKLPLEHRVVIAAINQDLEKCKHRFGLQIEKEDITGSFTFTIFENNTEIGIIAILQKPDNFVTVKFRMKAEILHSIVMLISIPKAPNRSWLRWERMPHSPLEPGEIYIPVYDELSQPAPADQPGQTEMIQKTKTIRIPKGTKKLNDWKARWKKIKPEWGRGKNYVELSNILNNAGLQTSSEIVSDIVKAGDANLLD